MRPSATIAVRRSSRARRQRDQSCERTATSWRKCAPILSTGATIRSSLRRSPPDQASAFRDAVHRAEECVAASSDMKRFKESRTKEGRPHSVVREVLMETTVIDAAETDAAEIVTCVRTVPLVHTLSKDHLWQIIVYVLPLDRRAWSPIQRGLPRCCSGMPRVIQSRVVSSSRGFSPSGT